MGRRGRFSGWGRSRSRRATWGAALALVGQLAASAAAADPGNPPASSAAAVPAAVLGADVALQALTLVGTPYRFGGDEPARGFDCSGLVRHVARTTLGLDLPRTAEAIARASQPLPRSELQGGDLVFFNTRGQRHSHVGVYLGDGRFVHAPARNGLVRVESLSDRYWNARFTGARRLPGVIAVSAEGPAPPATAPGRGANERTEPPPERHPADGA
jgi:cell wall-associated NlpC family hydrolase